LQGQQGYPGRILNEAFKVPASRNRSPDRTCPATCRSHCALNIAGCTVRRGNLSPFTGSRIQSRARKHVMPGGYAVFVQQKPIGSSDMLTLLRTPTQTIFLAVFAEPALAIDPVFQDGGPAIRGYDPVTYFTEDGPVKGCLRREPRHVRGRSGEIRVGLWRILRRGSLPRLQRHHRPGRMVDPRREAVSQPLEDVACAMSARQGRQNRHRRPELAGSA